MKYRDSTPYHEDSEWIKSKFKDSSGSISYHWDLSDECLAQFGCIYEVSKIVIVHYNIILYYKWLRRNITKKYRYCKGEDF